MDNREIMDNNILNLEGIRGICLIMSGSEYLQNDEQYALSFLANAINEVIEQLNNLCYSDCSGNEVSSEKA